MAVRKKVETRTCAACGGTAARETRPRVIRYKNQSLTIQQPAWWCRDCGEGMLDAKDSGIADRAFATLRARVEHVLPPAEVERIRKHLGLSQRRAGAILGGGARAFQRYETGAVLVSKPMSNLLTLLSRKPNLLAELAAIQTREHATTGRRGFRKPR